MVPGGVPLSLGVAGISATELLGPRWQMRIAQLVRISEFRLFEETEIANCWEIGFHVAAHYANVEPCPLSSLSLTLRSSPTIMGLAVSQSGSTLEFASLALKDNKEIVLAAVRIGIVI